MIYSKYKCPICNSCLKQITKNIHSYCETSDHYYEVDKFDTIRYQYTEYKVITFFDEKSISYVCSNWSGIIVCEVNGKIPFLSSDKEIESFIQNFNIIK